MLLKHTKGPWTVEERFKVLLIWGDEDLVLATVDKHMKEDIGNAHMMAAAPDLLRACIALVEHENFDDVDRALELAREAIKKARGL